MTKNERYEICRLLSILLIDMYDKSSGILYKDCYISFDLMGRRVKTHIEFEVGEPVE